MPNVFKALSDPIFRQDVKRGVMDALNRGMVAGGLGAPVDLATMALRPFGYNVEKPVGGSEWIGDKMRRAGMVSDQRNALAEAAAGMLAPTGYADPVATARAVAGLVGAAQVAGPAQKAMFIGAGAKTWDKAAAAKAQALEAQGVDARTIWKETGTFKGADGKWRQEIDDSASFMKGGDTFGATIMGAYKRGAERTGNQAYKTTVGDIIWNHPLDNAYPDLSGIEAQMMPGAKSATGSLANHGGREVLHVAENAPSDQARSVTLHELQHAIQQREGWAAGGSPEMFSKDSFQLAVNNKRLLDDISTTGAEKFGIFYESGKFSDLQSAAEAYAKANGVPLEKAYDAAGAFWQYGGETGGLAGLKKKIEQAQMAIDDAFTSPIDKYKRLAGEAEARATQARMNLDAKQRRGLFPYDSYDVKPENLIVRLAR